MVRGQASLTYPLHPQSNPNQTLITPQSHSPHLGEYERASQPEKNVGREKRGGSLLKTDVFIRRRISYSSLNHNEFQNFI